MRRREKFIISSILLALGLLAVQYVSLQYRYIAILLFFVFSYLVSVWALYEDLYGVEWVTIIPFPAMYSVAVALFYFLLPNNIASRIFILAIFGVGMYALYLTSNIYSVAKSRTIQLLRAAHTIGLLFTLLTSTLITNFLYSIHLDFWLNGLIVMIVHVPLLLMSLWAVELQPKLDKRIAVSVVLFSVVMGEFAIILSWFPLTVWNASLLTTSLLYVLLGLLHNQLQQRLFKNTMVEYIVFAALVSVSFLLLLKWK
jgi:hypothetical protein